MYTSRCTFPEEPLLNMKKKMFDSISNIGPTCKCHFLLGGFRGVCLAVVVILPIPSRFYSEDFSVMNQLGLNWTSCT